MKETVLRSLGLSEAEEATFLALVSMPARTPPELAALAGLSLHRVKLALENLGGKGLANEVPGATRRYIATPPELAMQMLLSAKQRELEEARAAASHFIDQLHRDVAAASPMEIVEVLPEAEIAAQRAIQIQNAAQEEVLALSIPPYSMAFTDVDEVSQLRSGVQYRLIYSAAALEVPGHIERIERDAKAGEEARWLPELPLKLLIIDRRHALVPLPGPDDTVVAGLQIRSSPVLDAMLALFESLWAQATPMAFSSTQTLPGFDDRDRKILMLIAAGLKDEAAAAQLDMAPRTLRRHISRLMEQFGSRTRIQLCLEAVRKGLL